jgi:polyisoprenoid-binding protein YceI
LGTCWRPISSTLSAFPKISFTSTVLGIDEDTLELDGVLTLKGVTRPVHAAGRVNGPTEDFAGNTRLGFTLETTIDRTDFGVDWNADLPKGGRALSNDVSLVVELEFIKG